MVMRGTRLGAISHGPTTKHGAEGIPLSDGSRVRAISRLPMPERSAEGIPLSSRMGSCVAEIIPLTCGPDDITYLNNAPMS